jgi:hypothetical protein
MLSSEAVRDRYGNCSRSWLDRRLRYDPNFPRPLRVGARRFWKLAELVEWEASLARGPSAVAAAAAAKAFAAREGGRPKKPPLAEREGRHVFAMAEAFIQRAIERGVSEFQAAEAVAVLMTGDVLPVFGYPGLHILETFHRKPGDAEKRTEQHRYGRPHRPFADDLRRTLARFRAGADSAWLLPMANAWRLVIDGRIDRLDEARGLALSLGEEAFFDAEMAPKLKMYAALVCLMKIFSAPQFIPND